MRYLAIIKQHWLLLFGSTMLCGALAVGLSFLPTQYYQSEVQLLIIQKQDNVDSYTAQRAAENIGKSLTSVIDTLNFMDRVVATGYVKSEQFSQNSQERKKQWEKLIEANVLPETGIVQIFGYGTEAGYAEDVALGVSQVLTTNSADYHGAGDTVSISIIDGPITSTRPVKPNIPLNGAAGAVLGFMIIFGYYIFRLETEVVQANRQQTHYEALSQDLSQGFGQGNVFPLSPPEYKVLDEYPNQPFTFGASLEDKPTSPSSDEAVSMQDHIPPK